MYHARLSKETMAIEDAQSKIRSAVLQGFLSGQSWNAIALTVRKIIALAEKEIKIEDLRIAAIKGLRSFAYTQYRTLQTEFLSGSVLTAVFALKNSRRSEAERLQAQRRLLSVPKFQGLAQGYETRAKGIPLGVYQKEYFKDVDAVLERLAEQNALDPDDNRSRNSLRNRAEMEIRYNDHLRQIDNLRARGVRIVLCSVHADCSDRCAPWQGRVYSLDGSSGVTEDGKKYVPLENATDHYYVTKKTHKVYKNGLLGFNCRHMLYAYEPGIVIPFVSTEDRKKEYAITERQRALETRVRKLKAKAEEFAPLSKPKAQQYRALAAKAYQEYKEFSRRNERAYYPTRVEI